jgi:hypothetical protein
MAVMSRFIVMMAVLVAAAQQNPPVAPAQRPTPGLNDALTLDSASPIIENERVAVWDFTWTRGVPGLLERQTTDSVWISVSPSVGDVRYWAKGAPRRADRSIGSPFRLIAIDLKDRPVAPLKNTSGFPNAFPRPGNSRRVFENDRVIVWDFTWTPGQPTPMHFHDKDVVVVYLGTGTLRSTTPDGKAVDSKWKPADTRFNLRDRIHTETLVEGTLRAIIMELK